MMNPSENVRNNEAFSHRRFVNVTDASSVGFARNGTRTVQLVVRGQVLSVNERVETLAIDAAYISSEQRNHILVVSGIDPEQGSITQASVVSALREYDEAQYRQAFLHTVRNTRTRCLRNPHNPIPRRSS